MNEIIKLCESVFEEGYPISAVSATSQDGIVWDVVMSIPMWIHGDEQSDIVTGVYTYGVAIDYDNMPDKVGAMVKTRHPDIRGSVVATRDEVRSMIKAVALYGNALDYAKFGSGYLTKPTRWLRGRDKEMAEKSLKKARSRIQ